MIGQAFKLGAAPVSALRLGSTLLWPTEVEPTVSVLDTFTRSNASTLDTTKVGARTWTAHLGAWGIVGERAGVLAPPDSDDNIATVDFGAFNASLTVTVHSPTPGTYAGLVGRYVDANNYYLVEVDVFNGNLYVGRKIAGANTWLWNGSNVVYGLPYKLTLTESDGATVIILERDNVTLWIGTDSHASRPMGTRWGLRQAFSYATDAPFDSFRIDPHSG